MPKMSATSRNLIKAPSAEVIWVDHGAAAATDVAGAADPATGRNLRRAKRAVRQARPTDGREIHDERPPLATTCLWRTPRAAVHTHDPSCHARDVWSLDRRAARAAHRRRNNGTCAADRGRRTVGPR